MSLRCLPSVLDDPNFSTVRQTPSTPSHMSNICLFLQIQSPPHPFHISTTIYCPRTLRSSAIRLVPIRLLSYDWGKTHSAASTRGHTASSTSRGAGCTYHPG